MATVLPANQSFRIPEVRLLIVALPGFGCNVCLAVGAGRAVVPGVPVELEKHDSGAPAAVRRRVGVGLSWGELSEGTVRPGIVIVQQVVGQDPSQMVLVDDQHLVQELPAQGADHPFAYRVRSGRLRRVGRDSDALGAEHGVERAGVLARAVPDQELD